MLFPDHLETDRLRLERLCHANVDLAEFYRICSGDDAIEEVTQYMPWDPHETIKETNDFIDTTETNWDDGTRATYLIRPRTDEPKAGEIAGTGALGVDWERRTGSLGVWLRKPFWGRGYSGERAGALMALAFERLDLDLVAVSHHHENDRSQRAIEKYVEKYGGQREGTIRNGLAYQDGRVVDEVRYSIAQDEYAESTRS